MPKVDTKKIESAPKNYIKYNISMPKKSSGKSKQKMFVFIDVLAIIVLVFFVVIAYLDQTKWFRVGYIVEDNKNCSENSSTNIKCQGKLVSVELATDTQSQTNGLSNRRSLDKNKGLLFVFETVEKHGIWMKDMKFPIDIVWIDEGKKVIDIATKVSPDSYPEVFYPAMPSRYVLEVNAGVVDEKNIKIGTQLDFHL